MRVLLTNNTLAARAGTELYVRDVATALLARGHAPVAYSPVLGEVADDLRLATIPVVYDLRDLGTPPDIIHGQHHVDAMTALLHFDTAPAVLFCHGWLPWEEQPVEFPRFYRYVAVDEVCRDRLVLEHAIPESRVRVVLNFVDLTRFTPRDPLPARPRRALVFSNSASDRTFLPTVREACAAAHIEVDVAGKASGQIAASPETMLGQYDVVFAKARAALEALAVGCAVILCDLAGVGPLVTTADVDRLRALNFGIRTLRRPITAGALGREIARYDAVDAAAVSQRIRATAGLDTAVDQLVQIYEDVRMEHAAAGPVDSRAESRAASAYLRSLAPRLKDRDELWVAREMVAHERDRLLLERDALLVSRDRLEAERDALTGTVRQLNTSLAMRTRRRILQTPGLGGLARSAARLLRR